MRLPQWVTNPQLTTDDRRGRTVKYHLLRAAAFHNPDGSIVKLSKALGLHPGALHNAVQRGGTSKQVALACEAFLGRDVVTREQLAPQVFGEMAGHEEHY